MKRLIRAFVDTYVLIKVTPIIIKGITVLIEAGMTGFDNSIEVLRKSRQNKDTKEEDTNG